jgi:hypothetical protein
MSSPISSSNLSMANYLAQNFGAVRLAGSGRWEFNLMGTPHRGTARMTEDWLLLDIEADISSTPIGLTDGILEDMLHANTTFNGGVKYGLGEDALSVRLLAEIPLDDQAGELSEWISQICEGFQQAAGLIANTRQSAETPRTAEKIDEHESTEQDGAADIKMLCKEAGWPCTQRADGLLALELDVSDAFHEALVDRADDNSFRLWVELVNAPFNSAASRSALHVMLLSACRAVRWARAAAVPVNGNRAYRWEVDLGQAPAAWQLYRGLASLSVACGISAREVSALQDPTVAEKYLLLRGWSSLLSNPVCS